VIKADGSSDGSVELPAAIASPSRRRGVLFQALLASLANARQGTSATKNRSRVSGAARSRGGRRARVAHARARHARRSGGTVACLRSERSPVQPADAGEDASRRVRAGTRRACRDRPHARRRRASVRRRSAARPRCRRLACARRPDRSRLARHGRDGRAPRSRQRESQGVRSAHPGTLRLTDVLRAETVLVLRPALDALAARATVGARSEHQRERDPHPSRDHRALDEPDERRAYTFQVAKNATKRDIADAVADSFKVDVVAVNVIHVPGKTRRLGRRIGIAPIGRRPSSRSRRPAHREVLRGRGLGVSEERLCRDERTRPALSVSPRRSREMRRASSAAETVQGDIAGAALPAIRLVEELTKGKKPERSLTERKLRHAGRNAQGRVTTRHRGAARSGTTGSSTSSATKTEFREGDGHRIRPNRSARLALIVYRDGEKRYIIAPNDLRVGDRSSRDRTRRRASATACPSSTSRPHADPRDRTAAGRGAQLVRAAAGRRSSSQRKANTPRSVCRRAASASSTCAAARPLGRSGTSSTKTRRSAGPAQASHGLAPGGPRRRDVSA